MTDEIPGTKSSVWETVKTILWAGTAALVLRTLVVQPFWIPSESMKDALLVGDYVVINKMAYGYTKNSCPLGLCPIEGRILGADPERGDVVVFKHPNSSETYVKRLMGLPGDTIRMVDGKVVLNGKALEQKPAGTFSEAFERQGPNGSVPLCENLNVSPGGDCTKSVSVETLPNGVSYNVLSVRDDAPGDNTLMFTVPQGHYFFLGDNRDNSVDSRFGYMRGGIGYVAEENLIGRASRILFSSEGDAMWKFWTWRGDRFFHKV